MVSSALLVEFLGTGLLLSAVAFSGDGLMVVAALAAAIALGGKVSGGHFNPAVTLLQHLSGKVGQAKALSYVGAQLAAAVAVFGLSKVL